MNWFLNVLIGKGIEKEYFMRTEGIMNDYLLADIMRKTDKVWTFRSNEKYVCTGREALKGHFRGFCKSGIESTI